LKSDAACYWSIWSGFQKRCDLTSTDRLLVVPDQLKPFCDAIKFACRC